MPRDFTSRAAKLAMTGPIGIAESMTTTITTLHVDDTGPLADAIVDTLVHRIGKDAANARPHDWLAATILTVRNDIIERWMASTREAHAAGAKRVY
ncbi:hypothetical protein QCF01_19195, partial [Staphylococcus aureus]|nr:hypothetical protein [Staphylococcus aureus]